MKKFLFLTILMSALSLVGASCFDSTGTGQDGGVFRSANKAEAWEQRNFISSTKDGQVRIDGAEILAIKFDPRDSRKIYVSTVNQGMFSTESSGEKWTPALIPRGGVELFDFDYNNNKTFYAVLENKLVKTTDQGKSWKVSYLENRVAININSLSVDSFDSTKIYLGLSNGELLRSVDSGQSWKILKKFDQAIQQVAINPVDTRIIYVAVQGQGLYRTGDQGINWEDLNEHLDKFFGARDYQAIAFDRRFKDSIFYMSDFGLLKSSGQGKTWDKIDLLISPSTTPVYSLAVNPKNAKEIYFVTANTLYKTVDGGGNWITRALPTSRFPSNIIVDPFNPAVLYLGTTKQGKQESNNSLFF